MEALMRRMIAARPPANRPPHIGLASSAARSHCSPWQSSGRGSAVLRGVAMSLLLALTSASAAEANDSVTLGQFSPAATPHPAPEVAFTGIDGKPTGLADLR